MGLASQARLSSVSSYFCIRGKIDAATRETRDIERLSGPGERTPCELGKKADRFRRTRARTELTSSKVQAVMSEKECSQRFCHCHALLGGIDLDRPVKILREVQGQALELEKPCRLAAGHVLCVSPSLVFLRTG